jgi:hypothetical protein
MEPDHPKKDDNTPKQLDVPKSTSMLNGCKSTEHIISTRKKLNQAAFLTKKITEVVCDQHGLVSLLNPKRGSCLAHLFLNCSFI